MDEREKVDPLKELGDRLEQANRARRPSSRPAPQQDTSSALALGWRIGLELVVAVIVGFFIGWAVDRWLGTRPWGEIGFFFLGVAAGMVNVYRTVQGLGMAMGYRRDRGRGTAADWDEPDEDEG